VRGLADMDMDMTMTQQIWRKFKSQDKSFRRIGFKTKHAHIDRNSCAFGGHNSDATYTRSYMSAQQPKGRSRRLIRQESVRRGRSIHVAALDMSSVSQAILTCVLNRVAVPR
jgi:hypothetical protein